jgi:hypothetical protein
MSIEDKEHPKHPALFTMADATVPGNPVKPEKPVCPCSNMSFASLITLHPQSQINVSFSTLY